MITGAFSIVSLGWTMIIIGRNIAGVESRLLKRELVTTIVTPLMHRQARFPSTLITNSREVLRLLLTILFGELLWRGMGILRLLLTMLFTAARLGSPRRGCEWNFRVHLAEITCWRNLESSGVIWKHLEPSGNIWNHLESSGIIWNLLEASGIIWRHLESSEVIWGHLEAPSDIWSHLEASGVIWSRLEASGVIWRLPGGSQEARCNLGQNP